MARCRTNGVRVSRSRSKRCRHSFARCYSFTSIKRLEVPAWATGLHLVSNAIDGYARVVDGPVSLADAVAALGKINGYGEWDVLVYAVSGQVSHAVKWGYYRTLRGRRGGRVKLIGRASYMTAEELLTVA